MTNLVLSCMWQTNEYVYWGMANKVSVWAGSKRTCPPSDLAEEAEGKKSTCISSRGIHNFAYPRTGML
jgi:hypothetical protein